VVYHDIDKAVPADRVSFVKASYTLYFITIFLLVYNVAMAIAGVVATSNGSNPGAKWTQQLILSILYLVLGVPGAFVVWHFQVYKAVQPRGTLNRYRVAYLGLWIAILFTAWLAIGLTGYGGAGFLYALTLKSSKTSSAPAYMSLASAICFTCQTLYFLWMFFRCWRYHNQDKGTSVMGVQLPV